MQENRIALTRCMTLDYRKKPLTFTGLHETEIFGTPYFMCDDPLEFFGEKIFRRKKEEWQIRFFSGLGLFSTIDVRRNWIFLSSGVP